MATPEHSLIFLTYNRPTLIDRRLTEVKRHMGARQDVEAVVFDNGSAGKETRVLAGAHAFNAKIPISIIRTDVNLGFQGGFNRAASHARGTYLHIVSDDVAISGDLVAAVGPIEEGAIVCHSIIDRPAGWNVFGEEVIPYPEGYYLAMHRKTWAYLGGFDERFAPHDYEDVDFGYRALTDPDLWLLERRDLPVRHTPASTIGYTPERFENTVRMRALFAEKWGLPNEPLRP